MHVLPPLSLLLLLLLLPLLVVVLVRGRDACLELLVAFVFGLGVGALGDCAAGDAIRVAKDRLAGDLRDGRTRAVLLGFSPTRFALRHHNVDKRRDGVCVGNALSSLAL